MKSLVSFCFLTTALLLSQPVLANNITLESPVGKCLKQSLPQQMAPITANNDYFSAWNSTSVVVQKTSAPDSRIAYLPFGNLSAIDDGTWQTGHGPEQYENRTSTDVQTFLTIAGLGLQVHYKYNTQVDVVLVVGSGIPYLTANRHTEVACHVDAYGRKICADPVNTDSRFAVITPRGFQSKLTFFNQKTNLASEFTFDAEKFRECLKQLH